jgi:hypothetical protein
MKGLIAERFGWQIVPLERRMIVGRDRLSFSIVEAVHAGCDPVDA